MNTTTNTISEQLGHILIRNAEKAERGLDSAIDFTLQQAPLLCQEYIRWKIACGIIPLLLIIVFTVVMIANLRGVGREFEADSGPGFKSLTCFVCGIAMFVSLKVGGSSVRDGFQAAVAPRLALIELGRSLIK